MSRNVLKLKKASLNWALKSAENFGDTSEFPLPFEYSAIRSDWSSIRAYLCQQDILNWETRSARSLLAPKSHFGFRLITQLDPLDFLVFAAVVYELGKDIEAVRVPVSDETVFSFRFRPSADGQMFDPAMGYSQFTSRCKDVCNSGRFSHVTMADIADFYPRIYHHRLKNALDAASRKSQHTRAVERLLSGWNATESYGIPVGSAPARLLAEVTITDIDNALKSNGITFVRFNDDYRMFAESKKTAYKQLFLLAESLYSNHGLQLQPQKTRVLPVSQFRSRFLGSTNETEIESLQERFHELATELGLESDYEEIQLDDLTEDQQALVSSMNLDSIFRDELLKEDDADFSLLRFVIRRMAQLGEALLIDPILSNFETLHPVVKDIVNYFHTLQSLPRIEQRKIGEAIIHLLKTSFIGDLLHHRMWLLSLFADSNTWIEGQNLIPLLNTFPDQFSRRKLILSLGHASQMHWFQSHRREVFNETAWPRRALLYGASCMPSDTCEHWYRPLRRKLDVLEKAVVTWAMSHPIRS
jgi:Reverse transcriptase (RNA-dependent DNA polymerase)